MAWEYIDLPETGTYGGSTYFTWEQGLGISPGTEYTAPGLYLSVGSGMLNYVHGGSVGPFTTSYGLSVTFRDGTSYASGLDINANNVNYCSWGSGFDALTYRFAINRETEDSAIIMMRQWRIAYNRQFTYLSNIASGYDENRHDLYLFLIAQLEPTYNWQSVPSISGKNGILQSLVQIKEEALNDGEPVSEASVTSFDSLGNINIPSVIDEQMPVDPTDTTAVTVTYLIPKLDYGTYDAIKLLIKKDAIPSSAADADVVVDIDEPTNILRIGVKAVGSLSPNSHYYFMIAVADDIGTEATSDVQDIWTGKRKGYIIETVRITRGAIETGIIETVSVTKQE